MIIHSLLASPIWGQWRGFETTRWHRFLLGVLLGTSKSTPVGALTIDSRDEGFLKKISDKASQFLLLGERKEERKYPHSIVQFNSTKFSTLTPTGSEDHRNEY